MKLAMLRAGCSLAVLALGISTAAAETIRIAEHRQARIDALMQSVPAVEAKLGVDIEVVEYPAPEKDYLSKILTELRAGNAPDIFTANSDADVPDIVAADYAAPITEAVKAWDGYDQLFDSAKALSTNVDGEIYSLASMFSILQLFIAGTSSRRPGFQPNSRLPGMSSSTAPGKSRPRPARTACCFPPGSAGAAAPSAKDSTCCWSEPARRR